jgi:hypothetical protein
MLSAIVTLLALVFFFSPYIQGRKVTENEKNVIREKGLFHLTKKELVPQIVQYGHVVLKPSKRTASYSNLFRKSTFFFIGMPTIWGLTYNFNTNSFGKMMLLHSISQM